MPPPLVNRGIRQKLRRGEWLSLAPLGYVNNPKTRNIEPDPVKAKIIKKVFEEFAAGKHTLASLGERLSFFGVVSRNGTKICKSTLQGTLTNSAYIGVINYHGEAYEGKYEPIISRATFEAVQKVLKDRAKPRKNKKGHNFPFVGLLRCGECGAAITAQYAHGNGGTYRYYRCTKRLGPCSQRYLSEDSVVIQLKQAISKVALCEDWTEKMLAQVDIWEKDTAQSSQTFAQNLQIKIKEIDAKGIQDMGKVISLVKSKASGVDGSKVAQIVLNGRFFVCSKIKNMLKYSNNYEPQTDAHKNNRSRLNFDNNLA